MDIGLRNHKAVEKQAAKVIEKWEQSNDSALNRMSVTYKELFKQMDALFKAAQVLNK